MNVIALERALADYLAGVLTVAGETGVESLAFNETGELPPFEPSFITAVSAERVAGDLFSVEYRAAVSTPSRTQTIARHGELCGILAEAVADDASETIRDAIAGEGFCLNGIFHGETATEQGQGRWVTVFTATMGVQLAPVVGEWDTGAMDPESFDSGALDAGGHDTGALAA